jgi:AraC family transcriptional regulator, arabinose operon regulatory protein
MDHRIAWAIDEIERCLAEPLDIRRLAAAVNLSPSRFSHLFRAQAGVSPMRFVRDLRMERASVLLARTFLTVKQVMAQVGCNDPSHFARDFRRCHGSAPREWRLAVGARAQEPFSTDIHVASDNSTEPRQQDTHTKSRRRPRSRGR